MAEELHLQRLKMHQFVESRMALIAPNLCRIVGAGTAAMLVSQAGGLGPLSKQPASNMLILGDKKFYMHYRPVSLGNFMDNTRPQTLGP